SLTVQSSPRYTFSPYTTLFRPDNDTLEADVCIVGSGAGGGVIAGTLASQGLKVVVLDAAGYYNESDFEHDHLQALRGQGAGDDPDRKSTRLNSSHVEISYAVLC